jgi:hypothetical protein
MRRLLNQVAQSAVRAKGSIFEAQYRRLVPRLGHHKTIWAIAHRLCRLAWLILHKRVEYFEHGASRDPKAIAKRTTKLIRALRALGYQVIPPKASVVA